ncbi:MAG TPA: pyrimidine/purine nucleoside phosphorylase [Verrucomicrobiota bacterium]|nr:hypothetical protein [Verrucomicrobiales bacterium]HRI15804.1 pyrimidine/purine nucleoside phosphorylase [Verrucomicrobiota bacterium]
MSAPAEFSQVTVLTKANVYFEGRVVSHTIRLENGAKKTLGIIFPGKFHFNTDLAERMEIVAGSCRVKLDGATGDAVYESGQKFEVPAKSGFDIQVSGGLCEYVCSFLG